MHWTKHGETTQTLFRICQETAEGNIKWESMVSQNRIKHLPRKKVLSSDKSSLEVRHKNLKQADKGRVLH